MKEMIVDFDPFLAGKWPQGIKAKLDILIFSNYLSFFSLKILLLEPSDLRRGSRDFFKSYICEIRAFQQKR